MNTKSIPRTFLESLFHPLRGDFFNSDLYFEIFILLLPIERGECKFAEAF